VRSSSSHSISNSRSLTLLDSGCKVQQRFVFVMGGGICFYYWSSAAGFSIVCDWWILLNQPFQNKWVRDPSAPTKQPEAAQPPAAAHTWVCSAEFLYTGLPVVMGESLTLRVACQLLYKSRVLQTTDCWGF
jgi:hypothetical protein